MLKILSQRIALFGWNRKDKGTSYDYQELCEHVKYHAEISR